MKLLRSSSFIRSSRRLIKKNPSQAPALRSALELLSDDPFHPRLHTHKLKGKLAGSWAATVAYDLRIVFEFVEHAGEEAILLESLGLTMRFTDLRLHSQRRPDCPPVR